MYQQPKPYDKIIIGGGSAGCVLANRLSEDSSTRVLVLEVGRPDYRLDFRLHMPAALTYPLANRTYNWWYESGPEPNLDGRRVYQPRGKVLGGSSSINGMIFIRGNPMDYDGWAKMSGLETWSYAHVLPYFKRLENRLIGGDDYRGSGGPLHLETPDCDNPLFDAFFQAGRQAGYPLTDDVNGFQQEGFGKFDRTTFRGRRFNAARAYLHPVLERSNLTVQCQVLVRRIILKRKEPLGLKSLKEGRQESFVVRKLSVVEELSTHLSCFSFSGVGNPSLLEPLGIDVYTICPVSENLSEDHAEVYVQYACTKPVSLYPALKWWRQPWIGFKWLFGRTGIGASNHFEAGGFIRSNDEVEYPNLQYHFYP